MEIRTEIEIDAPAERVFAILTDFKQYPAWNPLVPEASGELRVGERIRIRVVAGREMRFHPVVTTFDPPRALAWRGTIVAGFLFSGEHGFSIEPIGPERVRLVHGEVYTGLIVPFLAGTLNRDARPAFERFNQALKERAERKTG
jgi:hypothetical protein